MGIQSALPLASASAALQSASSAASTNKGTLSFSSHIAWGLDRTLKDHSHITSAMDDLPQMQEGRHQTQTLTRTKAERSKDSKLCTRNV